MTDQELHLKVKKLLNKNISEGYSKLLNTSYCYIQPSVGTYPFQFWWDTCFHVFMLCRLKEYELAKKNIISLFAMQEENGFVGHMIFWEQILPKRLSDVLQARPTLSAFRPHMSALVQPPLIAQAILRIYEETKDIEFLKLIMPKLNKYHKWLKNNRDFEGEGLLSIISPFESGIDWKVSFDEVLGFKDRIGSSKLFWKAIWVDTRNFLRRYDLQRIYKDNYFIVKEVLFNTFYVKDLEAMSELSKHINDGFSDNYLNQSKKTANKILEVMYDKNEKAFFDVYGRENKKLKILTPTIFFPMSLSEISQKVCDDIYNAHLFNEKEFNTSFPIPSVSIDNPSFFPLDSIFIWRGPTWVIFNWFLYHLLKGRKYDKAAMNLKETVLKLIKKSGFKEYYNPFTGEGYGAKEFTWSGLIVDME